MGTALLFTLAKVAFSAFSTIQQNKALDEENRRAADQSNLEIQELDRQRDEEIEIAQGKKAERVREADRLNASNIAALADVGGGGTSNEARFAGEVGFYEGIDLAIIEGNRRRKAESLLSSQVASRTRALNTFATNRSKQKSNSLGFFGSVIGAGFSIASQSTSVSDAKK